MSKCNRIIKTKEQKETVCYKWETCPNAYRCANVLRGIRNKLLKQRQTKRNF